MAVTANGSLEHHAVRSQNIRSRGIDIRVAIGSGLLCPTGGKVIGTLPLICLCTRIKTGSARRLQNRGGGMTPA
jgi:hypothetical protein